MQPAMHETTGIGVPEFSPAEVRSAERKTPTRTTRAPQLARASCDPQATPLAATQNQTIWMLFVTEMFNETNRLPPELRQSIANVGMSVIGEINDNLNGNLDVDFLVEINHAIIEGLATQG
jgi:flagellar biosynthesis activator protein FlaF